MTKKPSSKVELNHYLKTHYIQRSNWIWAAVLGANDGILPTASLAVGVAAATDLRSPIVVATLAGLVAGALSMAAGEYVSVSSQTDIEQADIERERKELEEQPEEELEYLTAIYQQRGLKRETAALVAKELTEKDALGAHISDELGITDQSKANPIQAAFASGAAFTVGGILPLIVTLSFPLQNMEISLYLSALLFLILLGAIVAKTGGFAISKAIVRITFWGSLTMGVTALVGHLFGIIL
jgi:VIT1/CCC1 family predicted Fe2+/Mn2+ transporter